MFCTFQPQTSAPMQHINAMIVRVLIKRCISAGLDGKIAHVEVRRTFFVANENLARGSICPTIVRPIRSHQDILPA
jgi:hypothetical protein